MIKIIFVCVFLLIMAFTAEYVWKVTGYSDCIVQKEFDGTYPRLNPEAAEACKKIVEKAFKDLETSLQEDAEDLNEKYKK